MFQCLGIVLCFSFVLSMVLSFLIVLSIVPFLLLFPLFYVFYCSFHCCEFLYCSFYCSWFSIVVSIVVSFSIVLSDHYQSMVELGGHAGRGSLDATMLDCMSTNLRSTQPADEEEKPKQETNKLVSLGFKSSIK